MCALRNGKTKSNRLCNMHPTFSEQEIGYEWGLCVGLTTLSTLVSLSWSSYHSRPKEYDYYTQCC